jgi:hypothetical protein
MRLEEMPMSTPGPGQSLAEAHRTLESRVTTGKLLVTP